MHDAESRIEKGKQYTGETSSASFLYGPVDNIEKPFQIHERFRLQARQTPDAVAVRWGTEGVIYKELDEASDALAGIVRAIVPEKEGLVGVSMNRSDKVVMALLGILKEGCAYVPLDPAYPRDRLAHILDDTRTSLVLTDSHSDKRFSFSSVRTFSLDGGWRTDGTKISPSAVSAEDSLAYVLYTSGSTGKPKGVCCLHKGVINLLSDFQSRQPLGPGDICSWWTSLNFDVSVYEIFSSLVAGGTLVVVPDVIRSDGPAVMDWLGEQQVTSAYIPPFMIADLEAWVLRNPGKSRLRRLLVGVEPIPERALLAIHEAVPGIHIINGYGPTEATVCATLYSVSSVNRGHKNTPIGKPVRNTVLRILDDDGIPVTQGAAGELHIGGLGLARGYLNREDLTEVRFIRDPFTARPEDRLYRTGDKVRLLEDGNLEFIGRTDFQVKIRGFRVELGEIETEMRKIAGIREAVALLRENEPGHRRLVAYYVVSEGYSISIPSIRQHLMRSLPDYMIPSTFVGLDRIPATPNGKTDRDALPPPRNEDLLRSGLGEDSEPRTETESILAELFKEVLRLPFIGIHDNFFELGGHSLLAVQLVSRIRDAFQTEFSLDKVFEAPTVADLAKVIDASDSGSHPTNELVEPMDAHASKAISFSQMRVWYLDQLEPGTPAYNICLAYRLAGPLDSNILDQSVVEIVGRHESLRTVFENREAEPVPVLLPSERFSSERVDLTHFPEDRREPEAVRLCSEEARKGFDLSTGPLFRCLLLRLLPEEHIFMLTVHHIVSDGWSMGIILQELMHVYSVITSGKAISLPPLQMQYSDFARYQIDWMDSGASQSQMNYWKQLFHDIPEPLNLIGDKPRLATQSYKGAGLSTILDEALSDSLRTLAARQGATLFMVLMAGFKALLHRYTQQTDLCVGTFTANRNRSAIEGIVGFFVNTVAIRTDVSGDPAFEELIQRVKKTSLDAYTNQDLPFERILQEINPERSLARTPLFQTMLVLQNVPLPELALRGLKCESIDLDTFRSNFDLTVWVYEAGNRLKIVLDYSTELFERATISRMLEHFCILLRSACLDPNQRLSELAIISETESRTILDDWSGRLKTFSISEPSVTGMFEEQARVAPDRIALLEPGFDAGHRVETTYAELNAKGNRIAHALQNLGVGPDTTVALMMDRSAFLIVAMLGIMKAGAAYVPLDPKYPVKRIAFILKDSASALIMTDDENLAKTEEILADQGLNHRLKTMRVGSDFGESANAPEWNLSTMPGPEDSAYVIYTSGSTGNPKGVIVQHKALTAFVHSATELYQVGPIDRILQFASPSFDASVEEIFLSLAGGATLVLRHATMLRSIPAFFAACRDLGITVLDLPTAFWGQLTDAVESGLVSAPACLRLVIIGGEQAPLDRVQAWTKAIGHSVRLFNTYGPTETTVVATATELSYTGLEKSRNSRVPIGRPLRHATTYVLDSHLRPVPVGVPGELYIGGGSLARGYLNLPEKTSESFLQDPYGLTPGGMLYKTGDRVRYRRDGVLEFLGRIDRQVKIRGFLVEIGEVEAALRSNPEILESTVAARAQDDGSLTLIAFVVPRPGVRIEPSEIRRKLESDLPDFMIPSAFVVMKEMPLGIGGKIDTKALPEPRFSAEAQVEKFVAPRNPVEEVLAGIWCEAFGIERVGIRDNFFDLGGYSLLSLRIIDKVSRSGLSLTPAQFMQHPTIEKQAQVVTTARPSTGAEKWLSLVELQPYGSKPNLFFLHSTPGDLLGYMNLINRLGADQPCYGFQSIGLVDPGRTHTRVEDMASFYIQEMRELQPEPPYYLVGWCYGGIVAAEMVIQLRRSNVETGLLILIETPYPRTDGVAARYYLTKLWNLARMGPRCWVLYARNHMKYRSKIKRGDMERLFSLELDQGPLANRSYVYRANWEAVSNYRMRGNPECPIRLFSGDELEEGFIPDIEKFWLKAGSDVKQYCLPGNHLTVLKEPGATILAEILEQSLAWIWRNGR